MSIAALFTIAKLGNTPDALQVMNGLRKNVYFFFHEKLEPRILWFEGKWNWRKSC
jgi:hypothetical protein